MFDYYLQFTVLLARMHIVNNVNDVFFMSGVRHLLRNALGFVHRFFHVRSDQSFQFCRSLSHSYTQYCVSYYAQLGQRQPTARFVVVHYRNVGGFLVANALLVTLLVLVHAGRTDVLGRQAHYVQRQRIDTLR